MAKNEFEAVVFDLDGVITKTAATHSRAWKKMFDEYLKQLAKSKGDEFEEFTPQDYLTYVDGKPRYEGVKSFLESRNITLPYGDPEDTPEMETVCGLGNRKNNAFNDVLRKEGVEVYPSTAQLLEQLKKDNIRIGVASSSKNAKSVLEAAGLMHYIETRVDGVVSAEIGLNGKPAPDIFLTAARNLGADPNKTIVVEDATSGVRAGKNGNFGLVLGLAREDNAEDLKANGADIVVEDLEELTMDDLNNWFIYGIDNDNWELKYNNYIPNKEKSREALLAIGNGYFGTRGAMEESSAGESNYPGTYIAGLYNRLITKVAGRDIENEDFVCAPNWLSLSFKIDDDPWLDINAVKIESVERVLDLRTGLLKRNIVVTDNENRTTKIDSARVASMAKKHQAAIKYSITPLNYSGQITFCSKLDGSVINDGVKRYRDLNQQHLKPLEQGNNDGISWIKVKTVQSGIDIVETSRISSVSTKAEIAFSEDEGVAFTYIDCQGNEGETITLEKLTTVFDSNNTNGDVLSLAIAEAQSMISFQHVYEESKAAWKKIWDKTDIQLTGDRLAQKMLRLHIYHLIVSASPHNKDIDAGITARGLHGEAYRGHIFWDELFILPFYDIHFPDTAKSMLMYRFNRLNKAREYAKEYGYKGAMFPWQSGSDGREETQIIHLNPVSGKWGDDYSSLQRHVSLAVAYNIYQYMHITEDKDFMENYGAEMFMEICRFWESKSELNKETGKYSIDKVMGPDEFHESYPNSKEGGLRDNAYTNIMVAWMFDKAKSVIKFISDDARIKLKDKIDLNDDEIQIWNNIKSNINLVINEDGIISQYDGYFDLLELDWNHYRSKYPDIHRMDRLLKAEGKSADDYKVAKQADTLMTYYNLDNKEINNIISRLGYKLPMDYLEKNLHYYLERTSHGSTLSRVVHAQLANIINDRDLSWELYIDALTSDYNDIQGGTTAEGIHAGVMAGTIMIAISTFAGIDLRGNMLQINPNLPDQWKEMKMNFSFKNVHYSFKISNNEIEIMPDRDAEIIAFGKNLPVKGNKKTIVTR